MTDIEFLVLVNASKYQWASAGSARAPSLMTATTTIHRAHVVLGARQRLSRMCCHLRVTECPQAVYSEVVTKSSGSDYMSSGSGSATY